MSLNAFLLLDKPIGLSSNHAIQRVRRILNRPKIGHAGTLDPLASGLLPIALNEATKVISLVQATTKEYEFTVEWGKSTDTDDTEGSITDTSNNRPTLNQITSILPQFIGTIQQTPPAYSAIKIDGKRAYAMARAGEEVKLAARPVTIHDLKLLIHTENTASFRVTCSKGTYVRSLGRDIALQLNTYGYITQLRRLRTGRLHVDKAVTLEQLETAPDLTNIVLPIRTVLDDIPACTLDRQQATDLYFGRSIPGIPSPDTDTALALFDNEVIALGSIQESTFVPRRVLHTINLKGD